MAGHPTIRARTRGKSETTVNAETMRGRWNQIKGQARQKWGRLTDDDIARVNGSKDELVGMIQERYGKSKEAAEKEVDSWESRP